jgi:succinate dehydrogenase / fumarate reductase membrane anchor subunit
VIMLVVIAGGRPLSYGVWKDLFTQRGMRVATLLFAVSFAWHAWIGIKEILIDYARPDSLRFALYVVFALIIASYLGWAIQILWR